MRGELKLMQRELATTMVYVTHDQLEALSMADRIAVMHEGVLQQLGTPQEIYNHPVNEWVAGFVGEPPMNFLDCDIEEKEGRLFLRHPMFSLPHNRKTAGDLAPTTGGTTAFEWQFVQTSFKVSLSQAGDSVAGSIVVTEPLGGDMLVDCAAWREQDPGQNQTRFRRANARFLLPDIQP